MILLPPLEEAKPPKDAYLLRVSDLSQTLNSLHSVSCYQFIESATREVAPKLSVAFTTKCAGT
jgi:hypothetical protein